MSVVLCEKNEVIKPTFVCFSRDVKFVVLYNMFELLLKKATFSRDVVNFESQSIQKVKISMISKKFKNRYLFFVTHLPYVMKFSSDFV